MKRVWIKNSETGRNEHENTPQRVIDQIGEMLKAQEFDVDLVGIRSEDLDKYENLHTAQTGFNIYKHDRGILLAIYSFGKVETDEEQLNNWERTFLKYMSKPN